MSKTSIDWLELSSYSSNPTDTDAYRRGLAVVATTLMFWNGTSWASVTSGGGGSTWESLYSADNTFNISSGNGFTIADAAASANATLTITKDSGSSGAALVITQSGSGNDVTGTSSTWSVTKAGVATFVGISLSGTTNALTSTGAADWTLLDNSAVALEIGASGSTAMVTFDTQNSAPTVRFGNALTVTDGLATFISTSNTVSNVLITNNTITTFGADADSAGAVVIRSTSLTTGALLQLQTTEATLNGGFYIVGRDVTATRNVFTFGEDGALVIAGEEGNSALTLTKGDAVFSDGSLAITDDDDAASFTVINNTATSASVFVVAGSGTFTGSTTTSFLTVTPSGLTSGTAVYLPVAALDAGKGVHIVGNALTTGQLVAITSSATAIATTGRMFLSSHSGATGTSAILNEFITSATDETTVVKITTAAMINGVGLNITGTTGMTTGSLLYVTSSTAGAVATNGVVSLQATGAFTSTNRAGFLNVLANTTTGGTIAHISGTSVTDGTILSLEAVEATLTSGLYIQCYDGAANDFTVGKYGATTIAGNASGTAALTVTAGDIVVTSGFLVVSANAKGITFTGTGANGGVLKNLKNAAASGLSGTQLDIEILIGTTPYYFTVYPTKA